MPCSDNMGFQTCLRTHPRVIGRRRDTPGNSHTVAVSHRMASSGRMDCMYSVRTRSKSGGMAIVRAELYLGISSAPQVHVRTILINPFLRLISSIFNPNASPMRIPVRRRSKKRHAYINVCCGKACTRWVSSSGVKGWAWYFFPLESTFLAIFNRLWVMRSRARAASIRSVKTDPGRQ